MDSESKVPGKRQKLGELLVQSGVISQQTLENALVKQKTEKKKIGQILIDMNAINDEQIAKVLSSQLNIPYIDLTKEKIPPEVIAHVPLSLAEKYTLIPVAEVKKQLVVAMSNPLDLHAQDDLRFNAQMPLLITVARYNDILKAIRKYYQKEEVLDIESESDVDLTDEEDFEFSGEKMEVDPNIQDLLNQTGAPQVVRYTNNILAKAIAMKASDIHIEPQENRVDIRCRIDGVMREIKKINKQLHLSLVSRIKILSSMDISIRRKPQDGRAQVKIGSRRYDLRVSTIPTAFGEKVTIRILNPNAGGMGIEELGFSERDLRNFQDVIARPQGIILVTGPTGSGKSSTLYTALAKLNTREVNIITVEDPVEFRIAGINQMQINTKAGMTFATGLRSILRQDPDIIMVGEIRDSETAKTAFSAAQTGHLVLSTLHTNDAPSAVTRLLDMGVDTFVLADSLLAVIGQRLVRGICKNCKVEDPQYEEILDRLPKTIKRDPGQKLWKGSGCEVCQNTGYAKRLGIFELLTITPAIKDGLAKDVAAVTIRKIAEREGFTTLNTDGILKAFRGLTTIEEVNRVAPPEVDDAQEAENVPVIENPSTDDFDSLQEPFGKQHRILIVDDNPVVLESLKRILEKSYYMVFPASSGPEALEIISKEKPDLVIADLMMPKIIDGMTLLNTLRSKPATRQIPVIMLTSQSEPDTQAEVLSSGANDYLIKPVHGKVLIARIHNLLDNGSAQESVNVPVIESLSTDSFDFAKKYSQKQYNILIVEDNPVDLEILKRILTKNSYLVISASSGDEGFEIACKEKPDIILSDLMMPEKNDGITLLTRLKSEPSTRQIPVAMLTSQNDLDTQVDVLNSGANDYLTKPVHEKLLVAKISRLLSDLSVQELPVSSTQENTQPPDSTKLEGRSLTGSNIPVNIEYQSVDSIDPAIMSSQSLETILIVDNNLDDLETLKIILRRNKYYIFSVLNGFEALKIARKANPDLIITDYMMPEMNGLAFIEKLKSHKSTQNIPVIMLTSQDQPDIQVEAFKFGIDYFLYKPVEEKVLVAIIQKILKPLSVEEKVLVKLIRKLIKPLIAEENG